MSNSQSSIAQDFEHLFKKTTEANKIFLSEGAKFVRKMGSSKVKGKELFDSQTELLKDAINLFVKLNIQHTSNLIDLGVAITRRLTQNFTGGENASSQADDVAEEVQPAFILNASGIAGATVSTQLQLPGQHLTIISMVLTADCVGSWIRSRDKV